MALQRRPAPAIPRGTLVGAPPRRSLIRPMAPEPQEDGAARCEAHGLAYDPARGGGCVLCRRGGPSPPRRAGKRVSARQAGAVTLLCVSLVGARFFFAALREAAAHPPAPQLADSVRFAVVALALALFAALLLIAGDRGLASLRRHPALVLLLGGAPVVAGVQLWRDREDALIDWLCARDFHPTDALRQLVVDDDLTPLGRQLLYANRPAIESRAAFNRHCPHPSDRTSVLGCYTRNRGGIFLLEVADPRLRGIEQVTLAHEMLHQAHDRLPPAERARIDALLLALSKTLVDRALAATLAHYREITPDGVVGEMHSLFATQVAELPPALESYYQRYFVNRGAVVAFHARCEAPFARRREEAERLKVKLESLRQAITLRRTELDTRRASLEAANTRIAPLIRTEYVCTNCGGAGILAGAPCPGCGRTDTGRPRQVLAAEAGTSLLADYNHQVSAHNSAMESINDLIRQHNQRVDALRAISIEELELLDALDSRKGDQVSAPAPHG